MSSVSAKESSNLGQEPPFQLSPEQELELSHHCHALVVEATPSALRGIEICRALEHPEDHSVYPHDEEGRGFPKFEYAEHLSSWGDTQHSVA